MKERPIIFSGEMVRALLDGRKTQTRRIINPQPLGYTGRKYIVPDDSPKAWHDSDDFLSFCPYGQPGDRLWVREAHGYEIRSLGGTPHEQIVYRATKPYAVRCYDCNGMEQPMKWRPSIHMPRWASRLLLEVTAVRVDRLQEITAEDASAEGCKPPDLPPDVTGVDGDYEADERTTFAILWNRISGAGSWDANPWVWVVEFKRIDSSEVAA